VFVDQSLDVPVNLMQRAQITTEPSHASQSLPESFNGLPCTVSPGRACPRQYEGLRGVE